MENMETEDKELDLINIDWNQKNYKEFIKFLHIKKEKNWDIGRHCKVLNIPIDTCIGLKTPIIKKIAKDISKGDYKNFLKLDINNTYEEKLIRGLVLSYLKLPYNELENYLKDYFEKYVDSWNLCDCPIGSYKFIKKYKKEYFKFIKNFYKSKNPWLIRIELVSLLSYYTDDEYIDIVLDICEKIKSDEYYVNISLAWLLSELFVKQREKTLNFLIEKRETFDVWTYNKTIQKIKESFRVSKEDKKFLEDLKIKK